MCDCHTFLLSSLCQNIVCQSLCRLTDRVDIHTIGSRTDHPAQSGGSKLQCTIKTILDLLVITQLYSANMEGSTVVEFSINDEKPETDADKTWTNYFKGMLVYLKQAVTLRGRA